MILTKEEFSIEKLVVKGFTNIEIGEELYYSADAIKKKLTKIYKLFGVKNRIALVDEYHRFNYELHLKGVNKNSYISKPKYIKI